MATFSKKAGDADAFEATVSAPKSTKISDAEWESLEVKRLEKYVDYKTALRLAKRNLANRDAVDEMLKD